MWMYSQIIIIIIVTVTKSYSVYIKYYSKQGEKIMVLVRILMSNILESCFYVRCPVCRGMPPGTGD
jgi:hypothetical protein